MAALEPIRDERGAWQVGRYADVLQALRDPRLVPHGQGGGRGDAHRAVRAAARQALSPERLAAWREAFGADAHRLIDDFGRRAAVHEDVPIDLVAALARPWSLRVALLVTGLPEEQGKACEQLAGA